MPIRNLILLLAVTAGSWLCYERAARNKYAASVTEAMNIITSRYVNEVEPRILFEGAMKGMVSKLDPYSAFSPPEEYDQFQQRMDGEITGIGIMIEPAEESGRLKVVDALPGKPAFLAGIRPGDAIVAIDGKETKDLSQRDAVGMIRGKVGTKVKVRVKHVDRDDLAEYELERAKIPVESVLGDGRRKDGKWEFRLAAHPRIGYVRILNFGERTAAEFTAALASYRAPGEPIDGLIIDLRYNPGGLLTAATEVCDDLLDDGLIVTTRGRGGTLLEQHDATPGTELSLQTPIVVLVDRLSASASEIVAACLQDHGRAAVAGQRSWGKGTVQNVITLEGGKSAMRLTIGSYHRPSGKEIHKWKTAKEDDEWGVRPDSGLEVSLTNHQNDLIVLARHQRDLIPWEDLAAPPPEKATVSGDNESIPTPQHEPDADAAKRSSALQAEAAAAAKRDPAEIDPQLQKALEYLQSRITKAAAKPAKV